MTPDQKGIYTVEPFETEIRETRTKPDLQTTLRALQGGSATSMPSADVYYGLSDLMAAEIKTMRDVWQTLDAPYRAKLLRALTETSETNYEFNYQAVGELGLQDQAPDVRRAAIELLWEDESLEHMRRLMTLAQRDASDEVRAAAASDLGRFILAGELGDLPETETAQAQEAMLRLYNDVGVPVEVRRRALEAFSNSSHDGVTAAIRKAYRSADHSLQVSAIFAMGRSCDHEEWEDAVISELESDDDEKRYEAARAAGELALLDAVPRLARLLVDDDREIQEAAVWSLGEIGGKEALRVLTAFLEVVEARDDDEMIQFIEDAISTASMADGGILGWYGES